MRKGATFSFVTEDDEGAEDLLDAEPGTVRPIHLPLFEIEDDETWAHGSDPVGTLYGFVVVTGGRTRRLPPRLLDRGRHPGGDRRAADGVFDP